MRKRILWLAAAIPLLMVLFLGAVIANNVFAGSGIADECYYPDSDKWATSSIEKCFRPALVDYYDGEE